MPHYSKLSTAKTFGDLLVKLTSLGHPIIDVKSLHVTYINARLERSNG